jgi:hypothetical protein
LAVAGYLLLSLALYSPLHVHDEDHHCSLGHFEFVVGTDEPPQAPPQCVLLDAGSAMPALPLSRIELALPALSSRGPPA